MQPTRPGMKHVQCKQCLTVTEIPADADPHAVSFCGCCPRDHHHGEAAAGCGPHNHDGPCWNPPGQPVRPDGCTVCRPLLHLATAGEIELVK